MTISLVVMRTEYKKVHWLFYSGLVFFHASVAIYSWGFFFDSMAGGMKT